MYGLQGRQDTRHALKDVEESSRRKGLCFGWLVVLFNNQYLAWIFKTLINYSDEALSAQVVVPSAW